MVLNAVIRRLRRRFIAMAAVLGVGGAVGFGSTIVGLPWQLPTAVFAVTVVAFAGLVWGAFLPTLRLLQRNVASVEEVNARLRASEGRYRQLLSILPDAVGVYREGVWQYLNPAALRLFGIERLNDALGVRVLDFVHPDEHTGPGAAWATLDETADGGATPLTRTTIVRGDGAHASIVAMALTVAYDGGPAALVIMRELSSQAQLEHQHYLIERLDAVGRLAGGIAHDFNNLLLVIQGNAQLALEQLDADHPAHADIEEMIGATQRAARLTEQLLAFSRRSIVRLEELDINALVRPLIDVLRRLLGPKVVLSVDLEPAPWPVRADPAQIEQVLLLLAQRARAAMPDGGQLLVETASVRLDGEYVHQHVGARSGDHVMIAVSDNGPGLQRSELEHVFDPFYRTDGRAVGDLDLATCYGIVKQAGGNIWVYSEPGIGTTFKVYLPRARDVEGEAAAVRTAAEPQATAAAAPSTAEFVGGTASLSRPTLLVAEDEEAVLRFAARVLQDAGYVVLAAESGPAALRLLDEHRERIAMLITDVVMPGMGGGELAEAVQAKHPDCRVLFMSGYTDNAALAHGMLKPRDVLIQKPFGANDLLSKVRGILGGGHG